MKERQSTLVFFFRYPITVKKYINNASKNARCYEAIFVIMWINTNQLFQFVICPINDNNNFRFKQFFDRFLKYLCFLCDKWSNKLLSTVCFHSIQFARLFEGH